jgi:hypothetical protein
MSCPQKLNDVNNRPHPTQKMKNTSKVYLWKMLKNNPNVYCWIPTSKKNINPTSIKFSDVSSVQDIPIPRTPKNFEETVEKIVKHSEKTLQKRLKKEGDQVVDIDDKSKYRIVKQFIKDKGLILYGGVAINLQLPKREKIYNSTDMPDYDFFSPSPWKDAVELADILYNSGFEYTEVRSGIHPGTYRVFSNLYPVADITYLLQKDFDRLHTVKSKGIKIIAPDKIMADMYKQLVSLSESQTRWKKVITRQKLFEQWTHPLGKKFKCSSDLFTGGKKTIEEDMLEILEMVHSFCKNKKLVFTGNLAYNTYIIAGGGKERLLVDHYETLSENANNDIQELFQITIASGVTPDRLNISTTHRTWLPINQTEYILEYTDNEGTVKEVCKIVQYTVCSCYKYLSGRYVVCVDYLKFILYSNLSFEKNKKLAKDYKCQITYLTALQNKYYRSKKKTELDKTPFQRLTEECKGPMENTLKQKILERWVDRVENRNKIRVVKPKKDTVTLKGVKGSVIRIMPRGNTPAECLNKPEKDCAYPCAWNDQYKRCFGIPVGIYRPGEEEISPLDEMYKAGNYPVYG